MDLPFNFSPIFFPIQYTMLITNFLKLLVFLLRKFTKNSATALPGVLLEDYFPNTLKKMLSVFEKVILVTGTNGKTTTTQMICHLLEKNNISYVTNKSGSNLLRGIASSLLDTTDFWGKPKSKLAIFEVEEGSMRRLVKFVKPQIIVVTNIFRDQLDAYGEIDKTYRYIQEAVKNSNNPVLILNGNDARVSSLKKESTNNIIEIEIAEEYLSQIKIENIEEIDKLIDKKIESYLIKNIRINEDLCSTFDIEGRKGNFYKNILKVPGLHNAINAACAILATKQLFNDKSLSLDLSKFEPAFGRGEIIKVKKSAGEKVIDFQILLAKNPAGMNLNLHLLKNVKNREAVLILLNDNTADGKDVSWIWDVDFSLLKNLNFQNIYVSGIRKYDIALRLKYEGLKFKSKISAAKSEEGEVTVFESVSDSVESLVKSNYEKVFVLPTYTAMLELRREIGKYTKVKEMWE